MSGSAKIANGKIQFGNVMATRMYCEEFAKMEDALSTTIEKIKAYKIVEAHQIVFKDAKGNIVVKAVAEDWD